MHKYKTDDAYLKFTKNPFMFAFHKWWYVVIDEDDILLIKHAQTMLCNV
jgi:hypothetical protein